MRTRLLQSRSSLIIKSMQGLGDLGRRISPGRNLGRQEYVYEGNTWLLKMLCCVQMVSARCLQEEASRIALTSSSKSMISLTRQVNWSKRRSRNTPSSSKKGTCLTAKNNRLLKFLYRCMIFVWRSPKRTHRLHQHQVLDRTRPPPGWTRSKIRPCTSMSSGIIRGGSS